MQRNSMHKCMGRKVPRAGGKIGRGGERSDRGRKPLLVLLALAQHNSLDVF